MRYKTLDSWRGICALLVVLYHASGSGSIGGSAFIRGAFLFVDFFFVLSGFVMSEAYLSRIGSGEAFRTFLIRRLGRVWPLHAAMLLAFLVLELVKLGLVTRLGVQLSSAPFTGTLDPSGLLPSVLLANAMGLLPSLTWNIPSWSIAAEYWTYVVFGLLVWRVRAQVTAGALVLAAGAAAALVVWSRHGMDATYDLGIVRCLYGFFVGVLVHRISQASRARRAPIGTAVELAVAATMVAFVAMAHGGKWAFASPLVFGAVVFAFAWSDGALSRTLQRPAFVKLGLWSYSIYMTHVFLLGVVNMAAKVADRVVAGRGASVEWDRFWASPGVSDAGTLAFAGLVIGVSAVTYRLIEVPGQALADRFVRRTPPHSAPRSREAT
jgi:peptidoglycan/LPS O-acetylase OafA/YrhL